MSKAKTKHCYHLCIIIIVTSTITSDVTTMTLLVISPVHSEDKQDKKTVPR